MKRSIMQNALFALLIFGGNANLVRAQDVSPAIEVSSSAKEPASFWDYSSRVKQALGLSGSLRAAHFDRDKSFSADRGFGVGGLWIQARPEEIWGIKTYLDGRLQGENLTRNDRVLGDLREAYLEGSRGPWDFKVGRQITVWGRADKVNPTDVWSVRDFTLLTTDDEEQRTGLFATQIVYNLDSFRMIGLWQPEWRPPVFPLDLPSGVSIAQGLPKNRESQWGLKLDRTGDDWDYSISYSRVLDRVPGLSVISSGSAGTRLQFNYTPIEVWGADAATTLGQYGLRAEVARVQTEDENGKDPLIRNSQVFAVLGLDRTFWGDLNINLQYIYRKNENFQSPDRVADPNLRFLAQQVGIISWGLTEEVHNASARISYKALNETLESEIALVGWWNNGLIRPKVTYAVNDQLRMIAGAELFGGDLQSFFGRLKPTSTGFFELRYLF